MKLLTLLRISATDPTKLATVYIRIAENGDVLNQMKKLVKDVIEPDLREFDETWNEYSENESKEILDDYSDVLSPLYEADTVQEFYENPPIFYAKESGYSYKLEHVQGSLVLAESKSSFDFHYYIDEKDFDIDSTNEIDIAAY